MGDDAAMALVSAPPEHGAENTTLRTWLEQQLGRCETSSCSIDSLLPAHSPRSGGQVDEHIRLLAESVSPLPPIIVHQPTMRVIDGMHRLRAAELRGQGEIEVLWYDGNERDAFTVAVCANVAHGLPLSLADRREAAARIIDAYPHWSDRMIASVVNIAATTVGTIRDSRSKRQPSADVRLGRDGRARPVSTAEGRRLASELLRDRPKAPLREIAKSAGLSPSTVLDVRRRMRDGRDPVPSNQYGGRVGTKSTDGAGDPSSSPEYSVDYESALRNLRRDPSLRYNDVGRMLLVWFQVGPMDKGKRSRVVGKLPPHCLEATAALARAQLEAWQTFVSELEQRTDKLPPANGTLDSGNTIGVRLNDSFSRTPQR